KIAINGFGRIGRNLFRLLIHHPQIEVVAIHDLADTAAMAHLLKYDSVHGKLSETISHDQDHIIVNETKITFLHEKDITKLNWQPFDLDFVIEAIGKHKTADPLQHHIKIGANPLILSVPPDDNEITAVALGVSEHILDRSELIVSNASRTTNNASPMIQVINVWCGL